MCDCAELVKTLREYAEWMGPNNYELPISMYDDLLKAADAIEDLENKLNLWRQDKISRWISVDERLPGVFEPVIVCRKDKSAKTGWKVEQGARDLNGWWKVYGTRTKNVTHWMPLPPPPKEEFADGT